MLCQNPLLSEKLLLGIPCEEGLILNTNLSCLKIFHVTLDFDLAERYDKVAKSQYKQNIEIQHTVGWQYKYDFYYWPLHVHYHITGYPQSPERNTQLNPAQTHCYLQSSFCWLFSFYPLLINLYTSSVVVWLAQENILFLINLRRRKKKSITQPVDPLNRYSQLN